MLNRLRTTTACHPTLYRAFVRLFRRTEFNYFPSERTELFIAGYPRSGNDYAKQIVKCFYPGLRISSHFHRPGAFRYALKIGVPVVAVVREPLGCVSSCMVKRRSELGLDSFPTYPMQEYIVYHQQLLTVAEQVPIVTFDELVGDSMGYVEKVRHLTGRAPIEITMAEAKEHVVAKLEDRSLDCNQVPDVKKGPDEAKDAIKREAQILITADDAFMTKALQLYGALEDRASQPLVRTANATFG
jgi:hypothetical protein